MSRRFAVIMIACVLAFIGILVFTKKDASAPDSKNGSNSTQLTNHQTGAKNAKVVLIEYGDYECPACYKFFPIVEQVKEKYKDKITFQFRNYPLVEIHQNALLAARAAEAADMQGKFWEMYSALYQQQPQWAQSSNPQSTFESFAQSIGLNVEKFKTDLKSSATNDRVQADRADAKKRGFVSTPTFLLNGEQLTDIRDDVNYFSQKIDAALAEAEANP